MKTLTVTEGARNFRAVLNSLERDQEEIVLVRNRRQIARLIPESPRQDALEVFGDLYRTLDEKTAAALSAAVTSVGWRSNAERSERRMFMPLPDRNQCISRR